MSYVVNCNKSLFPFVENKFSSGTAVYIITSAAELSGAGTGSLVLCVDMSHEQVMGIFSAGYKWLYPTTIANVNNALIEAVLAITNNQDYSALLISSLNLLKIDYSNIVQALIDSVEKSDSQTIVAILGSQLVKLKVHTYIYKRMQADIDYLRERVMNANSGESDSLEVASLRNKLMELELTIGTYEDSARALALENSDLKSAIKGSEEYLNEIQKLSTANSELGLKVATLESDKAELVAFKVAELAKEVPVDRTAELAKAREELSAAQSKAILDLTAMQEKASAELSALQEKSNSDLSAVNSKLSELELRLAEQQALVSSALAEKLAVEATLAEKVAIISEKEDEIVALSLNVTALQTKLEEMTTQYNGREKISDELAECQSQLALAKVELEQMTSARDAANDRATMLENIINSSGDELETREELTAQLESQRQVIHDLNATTYAKQTQIESLQLELANRDEIIKTTALNVSVNPVSSEELDTIKLELKKNKEALVRTNSDLESYKKMVLQMVPTAKLTELNFKCQALESELASTKLTLSNVDSSRSKVATTISNENTRLDLSTVIYVKEMSYTRYLKTLFNAYGTYVTKQLKRKCFVLYYDDLDFALIEMKYRKDGFTSFKGNPTSYVTQTQYANVTNIMTLEFVREFIKANEMDVLIIVDRTGACFDLFSGSNVKTIHTARTTEDINLLGLNPDTCIINELNKSAISLYENNDMANAKITSEMAIALRRMNVFASLDKIVTAGW